ncbi:MAG: hypothetical protein ABI780_09330 [Ardenticatenales bacterium]
MPPAPHARPRPSVARRRRGPLDGQGAFDRAVLVALTVAGLALRVPGIAQQPLQWDEGWSIALARLGLGDALRLTALDVHPPVYYALLHGWLRAVGASPLALRSLSALVGALAVPLAAAAARAWWPLADGRLGRPRQPGRQRRVAGWGAAAACALAPPLVYYAGVGRMYALATTGVLLAAWGVAAWFGEGTGAPAPWEGARRAGRVVRWGRRLLIPLAAIVGAAGAMLSFYYAGFAIAGLGVAALVGTPRAWRRWLAWVGATSVVCAPWLAVAVPPLVARMADRTATGDAPGAALPALVAAAWRAVLFVNTGGAALGIVVAAALAVALGWAAVAGRPGSLGRLLATALPIAFVCTAVAVGARAHMFAPRYATVATPFVALGIGWAAAGGSMGRRGRRRGSVGRSEHGTVGRYERPLAPLSAVLAGIALVAASAPTLSGAIYARSAEWFGAYDPGAVHRAVVELARPGDVVAFNILSLAGAYDSYRRPVDPMWTYAQLWDPVHEPVKPAIRRVEDAYEAALRGAADPSSGARIAPPGTAALWLALYKGTAANDTAHLKAWADDNLFPLAGRWVGDTLIAGYVDAPTDATAPFDPPLPFGHGIGLKRARYTSRVPAGGDVSVNLRWRADPLVPDDAGVTATRDNARVVVAVVDERTGAVVAQRDAVPVSESRPTTTWRNDEMFNDRHGLRLPPGVRGRVTLVVRLVDATTGGAIGPAEGVRLGAIEVGPP